MHATQLKVDPQGGVATRFAPSPTGYLHIGHAYSAILNFERARAEGGRFLLRIEDIDQTRCRPAYTAAIFEDLAWLGLSWEEPVMVQSGRLSFYAERVQALQERGLIYRCFRTRKDIEEAMSAPHAAPTGAFRGAPLSQDEERELLNAGKPYAWRLSLAAAEAELGQAFSGLSFVEETGDGPIERKADPSLFGDVVIARKDIGASYHLASVLDDAEQGVTHVIRGEDLREAASLHTLLHALLALPQPIYRHHRLILDEGGKRMAKRDGSISLRQLRGSGVRANEVRKMIEDAIALQE